MTIQPTLHAHSGEIVSPLADYASPSTSVVPTSVVPTSVVPTSTKATNSLSDHTQSDNEVELKPNLHDNVDYVPQTNLEPVVLPPQPAPEQFQGFPLHHAVAIPLPLSAMLVLRNLVRQVLNANTALSVACLVLYQVMLPTLQLRTRIFLQSALWAVVPATHRCLLNGYLPLVLFPSIAMVWIWHEMYLGCVSSFSFHGELGESLRDTCPHKSINCQALFGMVVTTVMSALCFAAEIGICWYIEHEPHGNLWLQYGDERLMANFLRGHRYEEQVQRLRDAEGHTLQYRSATQDQFVTEMFPRVSIALRPAHAQIVDVGYAPMPAASTINAFHIDSSSGEVTLADDEFSQSSEDIDDEFFPQSLEDGDDKSFQLSNDNDDDDDAQPYRLLTPEVGSKSVATPVQSCSVNDNKAESMSSPEILSPVPCRPRVSPLLYSQLSLTKAAYMPVRSTPHHTVQPPVAASFYHEVQFQEIPLSNVASPPVPLPLDTAVPAAVYSYDDPIRSIGSVVHFKNYSVIDQECIRRRLAWAQAMVDKENAVVQYLLAMAMSLSDDDEKGNKGEDEGEDEVADDEYESADDESEDSDEDSEEISEEEDENDEDEGLSSYLAGTLAQELGDDDQDHWNVHALVAEAQAVQELLHKDARVLKPFGFYSTSDDEGDYVIDSEVQVLAWVCDDELSPQGSFLE
ncbi:hypothetical protein BGZ93_005463 [Podila epicladia]|nr:hypothetical protein BGZ93_005463 [Podila epicladia]